MAAPDAGVLADIVEDVAARAPLRYGYDLMLVDVEQRTGIVRPWSRRLFPAGATVRPGLRPVTTVTVSPVTGYSAERVALPIVVRRGPVPDLRNIEALEEQRPLVTMGELDATTEGPFEVSVELAGPGRAGLVAPQEFLLPDARPVGWPRLIADLPERLQSAPRLSGSLDLVLLVELGGAKEKVSARVKLICRVVREFRDVPEARIAVLGYRDHFGDHHAAASGKSGREREALVVGSTSGFSTPDDLRWRFEQLDWWCAVPVGDDHAAPVEDALWMIASDMWKWRRDARHVAVIVGRRPPHPARRRQRDEMLACRNRLSWREALDLLQAEQRLHCFAVLDNAPTPGYAADAWRSLTASGWFRTVRGTTARMLAQDCGLTPRSPARLRLATLAGAASFPVARREADR